MKNFLYALLLTLFTVQAHEFDFSELVKDQSESVVNIQSVRKVKLSQRSMNSFPEELFREFGFPFPEMDIPRQQERESISTGSGFVIDRNGYVITNYHVVQGADEVLVKFLSPSIRRHTSPLISLDDNFSKISEIDPLNTSSYFFVISLHITIRLVEG